MEKRPDAEVSSILSLSAALSYGAASMAMVFINKAVLMEYSHSMTLLTAQQLATALLIHVGRRLGYTRSRGIEMSTAKKLLPVSLFYNANVAFALANLKGVNIPMYIAIKRLTPLAVLIAGFVSGKGKPTIQVSLSVILTAGGVVIAALGDFSFDFFGYSMALTSVFFQTMYLVLVEKSGAEDGLSSVEIMYYNSFLSLPVLMFLIVATGEFPNSLLLLTAKPLRSPILHPHYGLRDQRVKSISAMWWELGVLLKHYSTHYADFVFFAYILGFWMSGYTVAWLPGHVISNHVKIALGGLGNSFYFLVILILSFVMAIVLNYTMFLCTIVNSALTTTIVGVLKGVGSTTLGFVLLGGVQVHFLNVTGLVINTAGGVWYSFAKYQQRKSKPPKRISDVEAHRK